jgi:RHS repeat-associated protein
LGSSLSLVDSSGATQAEYSYGAFGQAASNGASANNPAQYTGRDNEGAGLQYNRARYYSPSLQRFISEDPIGFLGGDNQYAYAGNDPINFNDPFGLQDSIALRSGRGYSEITAVPPVIASGRGPK